MFVFILLLLSLATATAHRSCVFNCTCTDDSSCKFYCSNGRCQYSIPLFEPCSGYQIHPRECGKFQWCNSSTKQCERKKSSNHFCQYDYECLSDHCNKKGLCKKESEEEGDMGATIPSAIAGILFLMLIIVIIIYQKRIAELKRSSTAVTIINPRAGINTEMKPPPYVSSVPCHKC